MEAAQAMNFLNILARELESNSISLPSFPDAIMKIRDALESDDCDLQKIVQLANMEPVLTSRLLQAANSAYHNASGNAVTDLQTAVMRLGLTDVRNKAIALAVEQLFIGEQHPAIADSLGTLWRRSMVMSATSAVLADKCSGVNPDQAFMAGLLHDIGKLYMLTKSKDYPAAQIDLMARSDSGSSWHPQIGRCIVEGWGFGADILDTLDVCDHMDERPGSAADLKDIVLVAERVCTMSPATEAEDFDHLSFRKLKIDPDRLAELRPAIKERVDAELASLSK
ncbi:MAG: HDOD domain-containing protein [Woeseiaceae bacterium]